VSEKAESHLPELDGIRGLAILGVLCSHGAGLTGLFVQPTVLNKVFRTLAVPLWGGVDLFFTLSGFLITEILLRTRSSQNYFGSFYARRVLRIFPIYYLVLTITLLVAHFSIQIARELPPTVSWRTAYFLYLQNWPPFWGREKLMGGMWGVYWSLAVEEQFYFIWPLLVYLLSPKLMFRVCAIGVVSALPLRILLSWYFFGDSFGLAQITSSRVDGLLLGSACAIYMHQNKKPVPIKWIKAGSSIGAGIMVYVAIFHRAELTATARWILTIGITGFALLSASLVALSQYRIPLIQRLLTAFPLRTLGKYSYGIYVYHLFVFIPLGRIATRHPAFLVGLNFPERLILLVLEVGLIVLIAKLSYDHFESRFLRLKRFFRVRPKIDSASLSSLDA
jgi:peptidoglycan/LPS O-acetylase OafA/YrhL